MKTIRMFVNFRKRVIMVFALCLATAIAAPAQTFNTIFNFDQTDGGYPQYGALVQGPNGNFYGITPADGANGAGTLFEITSSGTLTTLYNFCSQPSCTDGGAPQPGLVLATNGNFYGTTRGNGAGANCPVVGPGCGTIFEITPTGTLTTLYSFCAQTNCSDGENPYAGLVQATNGNFYGTTWGGGIQYSSCPDGGCGTILGFSPSNGKLITLHKFCSQKNHNGYCLDSIGPYAGLVQASNGNFYGTTPQGGAYGYGTVFEITPQGKFTTLHAFCATGVPCSDGEVPYGGLVQAVNGNLYGTTTGGGTGAFGAGGTIFEITPAGQLTTVYNFCSQPHCADGEAPYAALIQATDGNFYGVTSSGGAGVYYGTIFELASAGGLTTLHSFCPGTSCTDGEFPEAALVQGTDGNFYGETYEGGTGCTGDGCGTIFSLSTGLSPFIETVPTSGAVGARVTILGTDLTGATSVTFNGTVAKFKVLSATEIIANVPTGATTGTVDVTTPSGTLASSVIFQVP